MERGQNNQTDNSVVQTAQTLSREKMETVCRTCIQHLENGKPYRDPHYCLWLLAHEIGISPKTVSASINGYLGCNFFEFITRMRLEDAKTHLRDIAQTDQRINIDKIGAQSGFGSRSSFFAHFARYERMTPKAYLKQFLSVENKC